MRQSGVVREALREEMSPVHLTICETLRSVATVGSLAGIGLVAFVFEMAPESNSTPGIPEGARAIRATLLHDPVSPSSLILEALRCAIDRLEADGGGNP